MYITATQQKKKVQFLEILFDMYFEFIYLLPDKECKLKDFKDIYVFSHM